MQQTLTPPGGLCIRSWGACCYCLLLPAAACFTIEFDNSTVTASADVNGRDEDERRLPEGDSDISRPIRGPARSGVTRTPSEDASNPHISLALTRTLDGEAHVLLLITLALGDVEP